MPNTGFFTGAGATGKPLDESVSSGDRMELLWEVTTNEDTREGEDPSWCDDGSPIQHYCNPGKHDEDGYTWFGNLSDATRTSQADTLFGHRIARSSHVQQFLEWSPLIGYNSQALESEILDATSLTRGEYIRNIASRYDLEPELIGAIILTEQRDQSEAEDIADLVNTGDLASVGTSIGLGQVTPRTAMIHDLFSDVFTLSLENRLTVTTLLVDEALNINATAKYLRLVADAGAQVENAQRNDVHTRDPRCETPADGAYENTGLQDLSVLAQPSSNWTSIKDAKIASQASPPPANKVFNISDDTPVSASVIPSQKGWNWLRDHYYVRVLGAEYTSCPFDEGLLADGVSMFEPKPPTGDEWYYRDDIWVTNWGELVPMAFKDCKNSSEI